MHQTAKHWGWLKRLDMIALALVAILSVLLSLLDLFGALDGVPWLAGRVPTVTLLVLGALVMYLVGERRQYLEDIQSSVNGGFNGLHSTLRKGLDDAAHHVIESLDGVEFRSFPTGEACLKYVTQRLGEAKQCVDDLSWSPAITPTAALPTATELNKAYDEQVRRVTQELPYREVFVFNRSGRWEKFQRRLTENAPGYSCSYYERVDVPVLQYMVIDREEVIVLSDQYPYNLAVSHPVLVGLFCAYYDDLWQKARWLKRGTHVNQDEEKKLEQKYDKPS